MSTEIPDFARYVDEVQRLFKKYSSYNDRTEHNNAIKAVDKFKGLINRIANEVTQQSPFEAKQQALATAIRVAIVIQEEGDKSIIGKHMREDMPWFPFNSTISHILDTLLPEELAALQADGEIPRALDNVRYQYKEYALDLDIDDSIDRLLLEESDEEDDDRMAL